MSCNACKSKSRSRSKPKSKSKSKSKSRSRSRTISILKPGMLTSYGYHIDLPVKERQDALTKAYKAYGLSKLIKRLNILGVYNKYKNPKITETVHKDIDFIHKLNNSNLKK